jgi:hypothetical protein
MVIIKEKGKDRHENDYYPTPIEYCRASIAHALPPDFKPAFICDPGAGTGAWGRAIKESPILKDAYLVGVDQFQTIKIAGYDSWYGEDYLEHKPTFKPYDLIIGNPPYSLIEEFIWKSLDILADDGYIVFLMRLAMLESQKRGRGMWKQTPLKDVWISIRRISFTGDGHSDDTAYGTFVWKKDYINIGEFTGRWMDWNYDKLEL